jgi:hypothetical protein
MWLFRVLTVSRMCSRIDLIEPDQVLNELADDRQVEQAQPHHF